MEYEIKNINGITTILAPMDTNSITIEIGVKAGSTYETKKENGISHFLEHMFFKGGKKYKTAKEVTEAIDNVGGIFNAYTGREHTGYYIKVAPEYIYLAIDILADMLVYPNFNESEIEKEKGVVIQELKMNQDNPHKVLWNKFSLFYYGDNPYGWPVIGTEENILSFTQEDLFDYKNSLYTKDNIVITLAGKLDNLKKLEELIGEKFKDLPEEKTRLKNKFLGIQSIKYIGSYKKNVEQNHLILSIPGVSIFDEKRYELSLLASILGGNMSSILFQELREKLGLCYYISSGYYSSEEDGIFIIRAGLDKKNFNKGVNKINEILDEIVNNNITEEQLNKAKNYLLGKTKIGIETSDDMTNYILDDYLSLGKITTIEEFINKLNKITLDDVNSITSYLDKSRRYLYYLH